MDVDVQAIAWSLIHGIVSILAAVAAIGVLGTALVSGLQRD